MGFSGAVLAGGRSSRFGSNKADFIWHGQTLLEWAISSLAELDDVMIVGGAARDSLMPSAREVPMLTARDSLMPSAREVPMLTAREVPMLTARIIPDVQPFAGALHGLATALSQAKHPRVALMACDMPNLVPAYWQFLTSHSADVLIPKNPDGQLEPLAAIYSKNCLTTIQSALARDNLKLTGWWQDSNLIVRVIEWAELELLFSKHLFLNANHPEDLP